MVCAMVCLSDDLIYSNILELFLVVFLCGSFGFGIPRFAHKPYGRHLSPSARVLQRKFYHTYVLRITYHTYVLRMRTKRARGYSCVDSKEVLSHIRVCVQRAHKTTM